MATTIPESSVSYEDLAELEKEFDDIETEIICKQNALQAPLYEKRQALVGKIPNFWPLVLEQAPPDIDQFIQPSDSTILATFLKSIDVTRFEVPPVAPSGTGNPRSVAIKFEFLDNDWFEDNVLEKKFWYRRASDGWAGLVSEPLKIRWKKGKDLTQGLTDAAFAAWEAERKVASPANGSEGKEQASSRRLPEQDVVIKKMEKVSEGSLSFFAWFGFRGRRVTAEQSAAATAKENARRARAKKGDKSAAQDVPAEPSSQEAEVEETEMRMEIFPPGEDLAMSISEDLFPGALKYFTQAQEDEGMSDMDFEDDDDDDEAESLVDLRELVKDDIGSEDSDNDRPKKKAKA